MFRYKYSVCREYSSAEEYLSDVGEEVFDLPICDKDECIAIFSAIYSALLVANQIGEEDREALHKELFGPGKYAEDGCLLSIWKYLEEKDVVKVPEWLPGRDEVGFKDCMPTSFGIVLLDALEEADLNVVYSYWE